MLGGSIFNSGLLCVFTLFTLFSLRNPIQQCWNNVHFEMPLSTVNIFSLLLVIIDFVPAESFYNGPTNPMTQMRGFISTSSSSSDLLHTSSPSDVHLPSATATKYKGELTDSTERPRATRVSSDRLFSFVIFSHDLLIYSHLKL